MDDKSRSVWAFLMKQKSEVFNHLPNFISIAQNQFNAKVKAIRTDQGTEFVNSSMTFFSVTRNCSSVILSLLSSTKWEG